MRRRMFSVRMSPEIFDAVEARRDEMRRSLPGSLDVSMRAALESLILEGLAAREAKRENRAGQ